MYQGTLSKALCDSGDDSKGGRPIREQQLSHKDKQNSELAGLQPLHRRTLHP
jgi:hypothetical protein